ncbi:MAG: hypothetical protein H0U57_08090 [Tatlockia sp.]|nr:hypothetical protein [Tatlockia sp.]
MSNYGGKRQGAGRAKGEETKHVRIPLSKMDADRAIKDPNYQHTIPLFSGKVAAGLLTPPKII